MNLIYKVIGNFDECDFEGIINKIGEIFKIMYLNDTLYLSLVNYKDYNKQQEILNIAFQPRDIFVITPITEKNIMKQPDVAMQWCRDNFVMLETERYEIEQQEKLQTTWRQMDEMEKELREQAKKKLQEQMQLKDQNKDNNI